MLNGGRIETVLQKALQGRIQDLPPPLVGRPFFTNPHFHHRNSILENNLNIKGRLD